MIKSILLITIIGINLIAETLTFSGSVISDNQKMITSRFMGFVTQVNVADGDFVKKGQLLYTIDSKEIDASVTQVRLAISQAQLSLQMYQNQYTNVKLNLQRHKRLLEKDMVSKYEVENLELAEKNLQSMINISEQQVSQARAQMVQVRNQYKYLNIKAPNDGVIIAKNVRVGEMAMPGMPAFILSDLSDLKISTEIPESHLSTIGHGTKVRIKIPTLNIETEGVVSAIIPNSNSMTHTFKIKISFKTDNKAVYPGMYATIDID